MLEVEAGAVAVEVAQSETDRDALGEGFEVREAQGVAQARLTREEQARRLSTVPVEVGKQGQEGEDLGPQVVRLIDEHQHGEVAGRSAGSRAG